MFDENNFQHCSPSNTVKNDDYIKVPIYYIYYAIIPVTYYAYMSYNIPIS